MLSKAIEQAERYRTDNQQALNDILNRFIRMYRYYVSHPDNAEFATIFTASQADFHRLNELLGEIICGEHDAVVQGMDKEQRWDMFYKEGE